MAHPSSTTPTLWKADDEIVFTFAGMAPVLPFPIAPMEYVLEVRHPAAAAPDDAEIILTWSAVLPAPSATPFHVSSASAHYRIYTAAVNHFRTSFTQTIRLASDGVIAPSTSRYSPNASFSQLVNLMADSYCPTPGSRLNFNGSLTSVIDFVVLGALNVVSLGPPAYRASERSAQNSDIPLAAFLETITEYWELECRLRRQALMSPMPWSRESKSEWPPSPRLNSYGSGRTALVDLGNSHLSDNHPAFRLIASNWGRVFDIPWLEASHEGYVFCPTLERYTSLRKAGKKNSLSDDAALWLAAMTFGLLEVLTGVKIAERLLLSSPDAAGRRAISGPRLSRFMLGWSLKEIKTSILDPETYHGRGRQVARMLRRAMGALYEESIVDRSLLLRAGVQERRAEDTLCAVGTLVSALCHCASTTWESVEECKALSAVEAMQHRYIIVVNLVCQRKLLDAGWCRNTVSHDLLRATTIPVLSNLVYLEPFVRERLDEHRNCTKDACTFYTIDSKTYTPRHVDPSCTCKALIPPVSDITKLLEKKTIPVVIFEEGSLVVRPASEVPYVALSHVWADGLGSTTEEGLPACQVARLAKLVQGLIPESHAFWMDSLCVPSVKDLRKRAIQLMAQTYERAAKVLVLDVGIRSQCSLSKPWAENVLRIATSGWVTRVWTLQEGILARDLYFEFADGLCNCDQLMSFDGPVQHESQLKAPWFYRGLLPLLTFRTARIRSRRQQCTLRDVIMLLRRRTTTKAEDETIAIAGLLPLDLATLLAISGEDAPAQRMKAFLIQMRQVPRRFPLLPTEKLTIPSFTWAPRSLAEAQESDDTDGDATCTTQGLLAEYTVARFDAPVPIPRLPGVSIPSMLVGDRATGTLCLLHLVVQPPDDRPRPAYVDCLLFAEDSLPLDEGHGVYCALVTRGAEQPPISEETGDDLRHTYRYFVAAELLPQDSSLARRVQAETRVTWMKLTKEHVRLV